MPAKKPSEVTRSPFWKEVYTLQEEATENRPAPDELDDRLSTLADKLRELAQDTEDKFDGLPDNFKTPDKQEKMEGRKDALEEAAEKIENIDSTPSGDGCGEDWANEQWQEAVEALNNISCD